MVYFKVFWSIYKTQTDRRQYDDVDVQHTACITDGHQDWFDFFHFEI